MVVPLEIVLQTGSSYLAPGALIYGSDRFKASRPGKRFISLHHSGVV